MVTILLTPNLTTIYTGWSVLSRGENPENCNSARRSFRSDENTCSQMMRDGETTIIVGGVDRKTWMRKRWRTRKIMDLWEDEGGSAKTAFKVAKSKNFNCCLQLNSFSLPPRKVIGFWILDFWKHKHTITETTETKSQFWIFAPKLNSRLILVSRKYS